MTGAIPGSSSPIDPRPDRSRPQVTPPLRSALRTRIAPEVALVAAIVIVLLLPAFWNGYPFLFSDTGEYLAHADVLGVPQHRTVGYSAWIRLMGFRTTLWATVAAQAVLVGWLIVATARTLVPRLPRRAILAGAVALSVLTTVSTRVSQLMPDIFAPVLVLSLYLVVAQWPRLGRLERALAVFGVLSSLVMHATHIAVAAGLIAAWVIGAAVRGRAGLSMWRPIARGAICVALGTGALLGYNYRHTGQVIVARNGHVFVLAHLVSTGMVSRVLAAECPRGVHYDLCAYRDSLHYKGENLTVDQFAWNPYSPLYRIGGWEGSRVEADRLLRASLRLYPLSHVVDAVLYTLDGLGAISTLDGFESYLHVPWVDNFVKFLRPQDYRAMHTARQQRMTLHFEGLARVHEVLAVLAMAGSLWVLFWPRRTRPTRELSSLGGFHATVWLALVGNAALCANLSSPFPRYQARLVWLLPFAVLLTLAARRWPTPECDEAPARAGAA